MDKDGLILCINNRYRSQFLSIVAYLVTIPCPPPIQFVPPVQKISNPNGFPIGVFFIMSVHPITWITALALYHILNIAIHH
jgi:hypothetical protein